MSSHEHRSNRRLLLVVGTVVVLIVGLGLGARQFGLLDGEEGLLVEVVESDRRNITQVVTASGKLQPEVDVMISPDVSGEVIYLGVAEGDVVEKGTRLVGIQPDFYEAQVQQAEAGVAQARASERRAKAELLQAENEFSRQQKLYDREVIPEQEFQNAQTNLEVAGAQQESAQYQVESAEARLREAREQLDKTQIYAPMSGTVSQLNVDVGERVVGTEQMAGTDIMQIARLDRMEVEVDVNENDVVNVAVEDTAYIEVDAYPDRVFPGVVTEIANSAQTSNAGTQEQVTNFSVKVRILNPPAPSMSDSALRRGARPVEGPSEKEVFVRFRPGMSATVDIFTETVFDAVAAPIQAVTVRDYADSLAATETDGASPSRSSIQPSEDLRQVVFVVDEGVARRRAVTTGIADDTHIEITSGLQEGASVITGPYRAVSRELEDGARVRVKGAEQAAGMQ